MHPQKFNEIRPQGLKAIDFARLMSGLKPGPTRTHTTASFPPACLATEAMIFDRVEPAVFYTSIQS
jgi:hypothetical protein